MPSCTSKDCLLTIRQLMAEKDRLIMEKDELVDSKDRLWREMHGMLQDKNERIEELFAKCTDVAQLAHNGAENQALRKEIHRLKRRHQDLEKALGEALEIDDESSDEIKETDSLSALVGDSFDGATKCEHPSIESLLPAHSSDNTATGNRQLNTSASAHTLIDDGEYILVQCRPLTSVKILPVIESGSYTQHKHVKLSLLAPGLLNSILDLLKAFGDDDRFSTFSYEGRNGCIERQLRSRNHTSWSVDKPGCFVCKTCFNHRRPCMRVVGHHQWLLPPLAPDVRDPEATWIDEAYYIYQGLGSNLSFPGVWELSKSAQATRAAAARQVLG